MKMLSAAAVVLICGGSAAAGVIERDLQEALKAAGPAGQVSALLYLEDQVDLRGLEAEFEFLRARRVERHREVVLALQEVAADTRPRIVPELQELAAGDLDRIQAFWIVNAIRVDGPAAAVAAAARHPDVAVAHLNHEIELVVPESESGPELPPVAGGEDDGAMLGGAIEPGLLAINAPQAWAMGVDGSGILVATMDTGVDGNHPALASRWAGLEPEYEGNPQWAWFDPYSGDNDFPFDGGSSSHGTHVTGTVCGGLPGDTIGVAPGAKWIAAGAIDRGGGIEVTVADAIESFQWFLDPDGDPDTVFDVPHVISNSWGLADVHGYADCDTTFWSFVDALETAGTVVVFAAGNEGFGGLRRPADRATDSYRTFAVAAIDAVQSGFPVAGFSSRGPTACTETGELAIKPDISGPGVNVRSSLSGGTYGLKSGTSMATPHLAGVVALVRQVNPDLSVAAVKQIMFDTALDLAASGEDNDTGHGLVDALQAVESAIETIALGFEFLERPELVDPSGGTVVRVTVSGQNVPPAPGTGRLHWRIEGSDWESTPMIEVDPNVYDAVFAAFPCGAVIDWYVSAENTDGELATSPVQAPDTTYRSLAFSGYESTITLDFESDPVWSVVNEELEDGQWDRGVPAGDGTRGDPLEDWDGSGTCWLTDNVIGNSDVDGGPTRLITSAYDLSGLSAPQVRYARWFANDDADADSLVVELSGDDGLTWHLADVAASTSGWVRATIEVLDHLPPSELGGVRVRFSVSDNPNDSVTEAAIDAFTIGSYFCDTSQVPGDVDGNGTVDFEDLLVVLSEWGPCFGCPADLDGSGIVGFEDLLAVLAAFGG